MKNPYEQKLKDYIDNEISYIDFCELIDENPKTQGAKAKQIKRLRNYMDITSNRKTIKVNALYTPKEMLLVDRRAKFSEYIEDLLVVYLANCGESNPTLTYRELSTMLCMVNDDYYKVKQDRVRYLDTFSMNNGNKYFNEGELEERKYYDIGVFFGVTDKLIKDIIKTSLKSLKNRSLIMYQNTFKVYKRVPSQSDSSQDIIETHILTREERERFLDLRRSVMEKYGIQKLQDIIYLSKSKRKSYFEDLSREMRNCDELYNCERYADAYTIEYGVNGINHEFHHMIDTNKHMINSNMQFKLLTTKELECISKALNQQFVEKLIEK